MKPVYDRMTEILLEAEKVSAEHRKYRAQQSTRREAEMDLPSYRKHLKRRGKSTKGLDPQTARTRGRGGPEPQTTGGDPEARGGSRSFRLPGGSRKAAAKIRKRVDAEHAARARADMERQERLKKLIAKQTAARKADSGWGPGHEIPKKWKRPEGGVPHTKHVYTGGKKDK